jgi:MFS family permease
VTSTSDFPAAATPGAEALPSVHRVAVAAAFLANGLVIGSWAPEIPLFRERLGISESELGLMILAFGVGAVLVMPIAGRVIAAFGSRRPMIVLQLALAAALPLLVFVHSLPLAVAAIIFAGVATGGLDIAMNASAVSVERRLPRAIMSSCHGFWSVGGLVGAGAGGFLIEVLGPRGHALAVAAVVMLLWVVVWRGALSDRKPAPIAATARGGKAAVDSPAGVLMAAAVGMFALFAMIPEGAAIDWSAIYMRQELGADAGASGLAFAAFSLTMAVLRFAGDGIRDRLGAVRTTRYSSLAAGLGLLLIAAATDTPMALLGFAVMGIGIANIVPIAFSAAGNVPGLRPGMGLSIVSALGYSGILVAPSAIGFVAEHTGFSAVFAGLSALLVVTFLAAKLVAVADRPCA